MGIYLYAQNPNIAKIPTPAHNISINPNLASTNFLVSNPKFKKQGHPLFLVLLYKGGTLSPSTPIQSGIFPLCTAISDNGAHMLWRRQTTLRRTCAGGSTSDFLSVVLIRLVDRGWWHRLSDRGQSHVQVQVVQVRAATAGIGSNKRGRGKMRDQGGNETRATDRC